MFDHRAFLNGEIHFILREFEVGCRVRLCVAYDIFFFLQQRTGDKEVEQLFSILENVTDVKATKINRLKQSINNTLPEAHSKFNSALDISKDIIETEQDFKEVGFVLHSFFLYFGNDQCTVCVSRKVLSLSC